MREFIQKHIMLIHFLVIIIFVLLEIFFITGNSRIYGKGGDWFMQGVSFYEYFRNLFYETGEIFPDLALHIGSGQNIYYFAYYGLYSPYLFLFYLFPNVKAGDFIMVTNILNVILSSILLYLFLIKNKYNKMDSLFGALLLAVSTGIVVFGFKFIMFVQYIPFLILGFWGTKKYLDTNKSMLLIISIILIITTSYYFSISSIIVLCLYALYYYIKSNANINFKTIFNAGFKYVFRIILSIVISGFLLLPVMYVILNGRAVVVPHVELSNLIPGINVRYLMYIPNGIGLCAISWIALVYNLLYLRKENRVLAILLLIIFGIPLFVLVLNGFLYMDSKIFVPFVPLFIILILEMLNTLKNKNVKQIYFILFCSIIFSFIMIRFNSSLYIYAFYFDLLLTYILLLLYKKKKKYIFIIIGFIVCVNLYYIENKDSLLPKEQYNYLYNIINADVSKYINNNSNEIYRTEYNVNYIFANYSDASSLYLSSMYSSTYNSLYQNMFSSVFNNNLRNGNMLIMLSQNNLFFEKFMGIRYLLTINEAPYGYQKLAEFENITLYENENVYTLGFASSSLMDYSEYNNLSFIEKLLVYQNNIIVDGNSSNSNSNSDLFMNYEKINLDVSVKNQENVTINIADNGYIINSIRDGKLDLLLNKPIKDKTLVIRFNINNDYRSSRLISINGVRNALNSKSHLYYNNNETFDYVISSNDIINELNIEFYKGIYNISDIEIYAVDNTFFDRNNTTPMEIDFAKTKGDNIYGSINLKKAGYFIFTIPYDKGYTIYVDNKEVEIEKVSGGFIGFKIDEGYHDVHLTFEAPYAIIGRIISLFGIVILIILNIYERKKD